METDCMYYLLSLKKLRNEYLEKHILSINLTWAIKEKVLFRKNKGGSNLTVQTVQTISMWHQPCMY